MPKQNQATAFSVNHNGIARTLITIAKIAPAFDPQNPPDNLNEGQFNALWDTGATGTSITKAVAQHCKLPVTGRANVSHAGGVDEVNTYLVSLLLPNRVSIHELTVIEGIMSPEFDILIGMDIITLGDFALTNKDGKTCFSFRAPSLECIDFVEQSKSPILPAHPKVPRNSKCPCGSGKKYKQCCGKAA